MQSVSDRRREWGGERAAGASKVMYSLRTELDFCISILVMLARPILFWAGLHAIGWIGRSGRKCGRRERAQVKMRTKVRNIRVE